ncbi:MAG: hypothetical protein IT559_05830 [Alphaproteobacteria bacterium]|nr:hypothetical protein [Alphaproteobacteria bacterium]
MSGTTRLFLYIFVFFTAVAPLARAQQACVVDDRACVLEMLRTEAGKIENKSWRDQTYRELAKSYAFDGELDKALALIDQIETPDTKAMTIRGIGMAAADKKLTPAEYTALFTALHEKAKTITHPPSHAIALTYIAMAQAFAGQDDAAWETAAAMENSALRHKAYGETAEIQAERGAYDLAIKSIGFIDDQSYRNKAFNTVSKIFADGRYYQHALGAAEKIENAYMKAQALQYILDRQTPRDVARVKHEDQKARH